MLGIITPQMIRSFSLWANRQWHGEITPVEREPAQLTVVDRTAVQERIQQITTQLKKLELELGKLTEPQQKELKFALAEHQETLVELQASSKVDIAKLQELEENLEEMNQELASLHPWRPSVG